MLSRKRLRKVFTPLLAVALSVTLAACGSGSTNGNNQAADTPQKPSTPSTTQQQTAEPVKLKLAYSYGNAVPSLSSDNNEALKWLEDTLGAKLEMNVYGWDIYKEKIRVMIASGDIPDAFEWRLMDDFIMDMLNAGAIVPLDDYISEYPNLEAQKELYIRKYEGKTWAITNVRNPVSTPDTPMIRQDWLDNLGLTAPTTLDELYEVAKAFTHNDPDQNGKDDTYGIQIGYANNAFRSVGGILQAFGLMDQFVLQDDQYVPMFATEAYKQYLSWMTKAFADGLLDPDFAVTDAKTAESKFVSKGSAGMMFDYIARLNDFEDNYMVTDPQGQLQVFEPIKGENGEQEAGGRINTSAMFVSKKVADSPEKMAKLMEWFSFGASLEGNRFFTEGVEGIHHVKKDGKTEINSEVMTRDMPGAFLWTQLAQPTEEVFVNIKNSEETQAKVAAGNQILERVLKMPHPSNFVFSETGAKHKSESDAFINNKAVEVIMGSVDIQEWDSIIEQWYERFEGKKWMEEIAAATK